MVLTEDRMVTQEVVEDPEAVVVLDLAVDQEVDLLMDLEVMAVVTEADPVVVMAGLAEVMVDEVALHLMVVVDIQDSGKDYILIHSFFIISVSLLVRLIGQLLIKKHFT